jgi:SAM-dependent methyltransferase
LRARTAPIALRAYYTRYYRDTLGIPVGATYVERRLDDAPYEGQRLDRLEARPSDRSVRGLRVLNLGCGTGGFSVTAERAGALTWGVDVDPDAVAMRRARHPMDASRALAAEVAAVPIPRASTSCTACPRSSTWRMPSRALSEIARCARPDR